MNFTGMGKVGSFLVVLSFVCLHGCGQGTYAEELDRLYKGTVPLIQPDSLEKIVKTVVILDTRSESEYGVSHIEGARFVDYEQFSIKSMDRFEKDTPIVVYCSVGYRSERIGEQLQTAGYGKVANLYGGIFEWKNTDHTVVDSENKPTDRVHTYNKNWSRWLKKGIKVYE